MSVAIVAVCDGVHKRFWWYLFSNRSRAQASYRQSRTQPDKHELVFGNMFTKMSPLSTTTQRALVVFFLLTKQMKQQQEQERLLLMDNSH